MCGIAGILGRIEPALHDALRRMASAMRHRGPDGEGFFTSDVDARGFGCLFAHRRLSILDLSHAADQPMTDVVTGQTIVFNGEIYGYRELRRELEADGQRFTSSGDTEVMLRALALHGVAALPRLRGMFAFGLWDGARGELLLARDPLGIKPLYVARNPDPNGAWRVLFASELRALLASGLLRTPRLDPVAVASVVWNGFPVAPHTMVEGVRSLLPGTAMTFDRDGARHRELTYACVAPPDRAARTTEQDFAAALRASVEAHLVSDVPLGVFLSGGIDSSAVAHLAQRASRERVSTFTLSFRESELDEAPHARAIAEAIGTDHHEIPLTEAKFVGDLETALQTLDQPTFDGLNSYYMSQAVREAGLTVALVGTGGDELFGGYTSFRQIPKLQRMLHATRWLSRSATAAAARFALRLRRGAADVPPQTGMAKLPAMIAAGDDLLALYQLGYALFLPDFQARLLAGGPKPLPTGLPASRVDLLRSEIAGHPTLAALSILEQRVFLGERLLRDSDAASMAVSLEMRLPLVDAELTRVVHGLPHEQRFHPVGRKAALRRAGLDGLDPNLFERPKSGFVLPYDRWIRQRLGSAMDAVMLDPAAAASVGLSGELVAGLWNAFRAGAPGLYWSRVWALYVLMRWSAQHGVRL